MIFLLFQKIDKNIYIIFASFENGISFVKFENYLQSSNKNERSKNKFPIKKKVKIL